MPRSLCLHTEKSRRREAFLAALLVFFVNGRVWERPAMSWPRRAQSAAKLFVAWCAAHRQSRPRLDHRPSDLFYLTISDYISSN